MVGGLQLEHEELPLIKKMGLSVEEDSKQFHSNWDIIDNEKRKIMASYKLFDINNNKSAYFQVKLFLKDREGVYRKRNSVSLCLKELEHLTTKLRDILYFHYSL